MGLLHNVVLTLLPVAAAVEVKYTNTTTVLTKFIWLVKMVVLVAVGRKPKRVAVVFQLLVMLVVLVELVLAALVVVAVEPVQLVLMLLPTQAVLAVLAQQTQ